MSEDQIKHMAEGAVTSMKTAVRVLELVVMNLTEGAEKNPRLSIAAITGGNALILIGQAVKWLEDDPMLAAQATTETA